MSARAVVDTITANVPRRRVALRVGNIALIVALAAISVAATPANVPVAIWWPAAGVSAWLTITAPERQRNWAYVTVFAAVTLGCLLGGRAPLLSLAFGAAGTVEIALFTTLLLHRRTDARILGAADALRLAVVAAIASTTFGLLAATIAAVASPAADAWRTFISVALLAGSSHLSALLLITPLVLLPDRPYDKPRRAEAIAQIVVTVISVVIAFVIFTQIRLEFLVLLPLTWAGARFSAKIAQTEAVLVAFAVVALSLASWHPLAPDRYVALALATGLTAFLCTIAIITTATCAERGQSLDNARHALQAAEATDAARTAAETLRIRYDLERQREDFLATTSHELRTPVTIIAGYTELLGETPDLPGQTRPWIHAIDRNTHRLAGMLDDLLAFSVTQTTAPAHDSLPVCTLVNDVVGRYAEDAHRKDIAIDVARMPHLVAHADAAHAHRALAGLVSNAVKFTPTGGRVQIEVAQVADDVMITVTDNGPGMADDTLSQAFDPFYRGEFAGVAAAPGTGLGLTIARKLARWNGGEVRIVSRPGLGTKATLLLRRDTTEGA